jgi:hypothetical protein
MVPEEVSASRSAADHSKENRAEDYTTAWLDRVEASVEQAHAMLLTPERSGVMQFTGEMEWARRERSCLAVNPVLTPRLAALRARLDLVRSMLRQAAALEQAHEQLKTDCVLGYTPTGLERAL